MDFLKA